MKFGKQLEELMTVEWREHYINYAEMKVLIINGVADAPKPQSVPRIIIIDYYRQFENNFFEKCASELNRVELFYAHKLAEAYRKHVTFKVNFMTFDRQNNDRPSGSLSYTQNMGLDKRKMRRTYSEFYLSLILLQNYQTLNHMGFRKICKKYDKNFHSDEGDKWCRYVLEKSKFTNLPQLQNIIVEVEDLYTHFLTNGDRSKAMSKLRVPPLGVRTPLDKVFCAGFLLGLFLVSGIMCVMSYFASYDKIEFLSEFIRLYRGPIVWILYCFYFSINMYVWQVVGINHVLIFEINPRSQSQPATILQAASGLGFICSLTILGFLHHQQFGIGDPCFLPLVFVVIVIILLLNPIRIMNYESRIWLLKVIGRLFTAPFHYISFAEFWLAEQFMSLTTCMVDFYILFRFYMRYFSDSEYKFDFETELPVTILQLLPSSLRLTQCFRRYSDTKSKKFLYNAGKYTSVFPVIIFSKLQLETQDNYETIINNPWFWGYVISSIVSTTYFIYWDNFKDFGVFKVCWNHENKFLRKDIIYPKSFYYFAIVQNFVLRLFWILELYLDLNDYTLPYNVKSYACFCEVTRRFFWNFLRLDNEHLYNCGHFRATRNISLIIPNEEQQTKIDKLLQELLPGQPEHSKKL